VNVLDAVRSGYQAGLCLLPTRADGTKAPDVASWKTFQLARPALEQMRVWDFAHRDGFGVIAGPVSGFRECWDFDDPSTYQAFVDAAAACGLGDVVSRIIAGFENETPNGGRRWIVTYPPSVTSQDVTLARRPGRAGEPKTKTLIELPTFAIVAPSNGATHPSGRAYHQLSGGFDTIASSGD
jgi:Bifunctional DNA primase/polymerase, N-terminal